MIPKEGSISIGGKDLREVSQGSLRKNVSIVLQQAILFSRTIADSKANSMLLPEVEWAAELPKPVRFIGRMADSFDSQVEERG